MRESKQLPAQAAATNRGLRRAAQSTIARDAGLSDPPRAYFQRPTPAQLQKLQRQVGNRAARRLLAPAARVQRQERPTGIIDSDFDEMFEAAEAQHEELRQQSITEAVALLDLIQQHDDQGYLARLRRLGPVVRRHLHDDTAFNAEVADSLSGQTLFTTRAILQFGPTFPNYVIQFQRAVANRETQRVSDLLRGYEELRTPYLDAGGLIDVEYRGRPDRAQLVALARDPELARGEGQVGYASAHYDHPNDELGRDRTDQPLIVEAGRSVARMEIGRTSGELRVAVRIRFVEQNPQQGNRQQLTMNRPTYYPPPSLLAEWRSGIDAQWNNRFVATNGQDRLTVVFAPLFNVENDVHYTVAVATGSGRSHMNLWYTGRGEQGQLAAHEFGHMVGNPDEYRLVATPEEIPAGAGFSQEEAQSVTYGGITGETPETATAGAPGTTVANSIMGDESGPAQPRHAWPVLDYYNGHLRPAGEPPFHLE